MLPLLLLCYACSVEVQLVGDRKNTRVDQRILHLDVAAAALKLVRACMMLPGTAKPVWGMDGQQLGDMSRP